MDVLKAQLARMQEQLSQLTATQKMLAGSLAAVMVLTLLFWGRYAGTADYEPLFDQTLTQEEIAKITDALGQKGAVYRVANGTVLVPADRKVELMAVVSYKKLAPQRTFDSYDKIISKLNPFSSDADNVATRIDARARLLSDVIRNMQGVRTATVIIDPTAERKLGGAGRKPVASISITTEPDHPRRDEKALAEAAAATVSGAQSGLELKNITVVINGRRHFIRDNNDAMGAGGGNEFFLREREAEEAVVQTITNHLTGFGNVLVSVKADLSVQSETLVADLIDPKNSLSKEKSIESENTEETAPAPSTGEPGAISNSPLAVNEPAATAAAGTSSTRERTRTEMENFIGKTRSEKMIPAGQIKFVSASVLVPRTRYVESFKSRNPSAKEPDENAIQALLETDKTVIRTAVKNTAGIADDSAIAVNMYDDQLSLMAASTTVGTAQARATSGIGALVSGHYKEIALGALALISLYMVSSMVKKGAPAPIAAAPLELGEAPVLAADEDVAGDVSEGNTMLDGIEMDEDAVKAQQMVEQVSVMVKENPDAAANLVKRWLNRS